MGFGAARFEGMDARRKSVVRRTVLLAQLKHKQHTKPGVLFEFVLECIDEKEFFILKAIGWVLREYGKFDPNRVKSFLQEHN